MKYTRINRFTRSQGSGRLNDRFHTVEEKKITNSFSDAVAHVHTVHTHTR